MNNPLIPDPYLHYKYTFCSYKTFELENQTPIIQATIKTFVVLKFNNLISINIIKNPKDIILIKEHRFVDYTISPNEIKIWISND